MRRPVQHHTQHLIVTPAVLGLGMLFIVLLMTANMTVFKVIDFPLQALPVLGPYLPTGLVSSVAIVIFPFTYFLGDVLTEVYGFKTSRFVIFMGLVGLMISNLFIQFSVRIPPAALWPHQGAYATVMGASWRVNTASMAAYAVGESLNALVLSRLKVYTHGRWLWLRAALGTTVGNALDTWLFFTLALGHMLSGPALYQVIGLEFGIKTLYDMASLPLLYLVCRWLKHADGYDIYDRA
jgi:uncharacterized integral membrane protein (TIGR00697 family)